MIRSVTRIQTGSFSNLIPDRLGIDVRALAVLRVTLGTLILADLALRSRFLVAHLTDHGVLPRESVAASQNPWHFSLHLMSGEPWAQALLFGLAGLLAVALILGVHTRLATIGSWVLLASLHVRAPELLQSGDTLLRLLLFWAMFLPLGATWSVDRALQSSGSPPPRRVVSMGTAAILLQVAFVYVFSAIFKLHPVWIPEGRAVQHALMLEQFATPLAIPFLELEGLLRTATYGTVLLEFFGPLVALSSLASHRVRFAIVLAFAGLHLSFMAFMTLGLFPLISLAAWIPFVPSHVWDRLEGWICRPDRAPTFGRIARALRVGAVRRAGELLYQRIAGNRAGGVTVPAHLSRQGISWTPGPATNVLALTLLGYAAAWNVVSLGPSHAAPAEFRWLGHVLRLEQEWRMFANPSTRSGYVVPVASLEGGESVELGPTGKPLQEPPEAIVLQAGIDLLQGDADYLRRIRRARESWGFYRWRKFHEGVVGDDRLRRDYARFLCSAHAESDPEEPRIERVALYLDHHRVDRSTHDWQPRVREELIEVECASRTRERESTGAMSSIPRSKRNRGGGSAPATPISPRPRPGMRPPSPGRRRSIRWYRPRARHR